MYFPLKLYHSFFNLLDCFFFTTFNIERNDSWNRHSNLKIIMAEQNIYIRLFHIWTSQFAFLIECHIELFDTLSCSQTTWLPHAIKPSSDKERESECCLPVIKSTPAIIKVIWGRLTTGTTTSRKPKTKRLHWPCAFFQIIFFALAYSLYQSEKSRTNPMFQTVKSKS